MIKEHKKLYAEYIINKLIEWNGPDLSIFNISKVLQMIWFVTMTDRYAYYKNIPCMLDIFDKWIVDNIIYESDIFNFLKYDDIKSFSFNEGYHVVIKEQYIPKLPNHIYKKIIDNAIEKLKHINPNIIKYDFTELKELTYSCFIIKSQKSITDIYKTNKDFDINKYIIDYLIPEYKNAKINYISDYDNYYNKPDKHICIRKTYKNIFYKILNFFHINI